MTNSLQLGGLYLLMAVMLMLGMLMTRREPAVRLFTYGLAWVAVFASGFILLAFRDNLGWVAQRLRAEADGTPISEGREMRIPMAIDGHFWVKARLNGHDVRFLVDSGATTTTVDRGTAEAADHSADGRTEAGLVAGATRRRHGQSGDDNCDPTHWMPPFPHVGISPRHAHHEFASRAHRLERAGHTGESAGLSMLFPP